MLTQRKLYLQIPDQEIILKEHGYRHRRAKMGMSLSPQKEMWCAGKPPGRNLSGCLNPGQCPLFNSLKPTCLTDSRGCLLFLPNPFSWGLMFDVFDLWGGMAMGLAG